MKGGRVCIPSCRSFIGSQLSWFCRQNRSALDFLVAASFKQCLFMILAKRAAEFKAVTHVTHLIASSSAVALQYPLSVSFSCVRSLKQNLNTYCLLAYSNHNISTATSADHFSFVRFRCFSFLICFEL